MHIDINETSGICVKYIRNIDIYICKIICREKELKSEVPFNQKTKTI